MDRRYRRRRLVAAGVLVVVVAGAVAVAALAYRHFHRSTPAGEPGMRFKMIGYGRSSYLANNGQCVSWPALGVALQKNYISVYVSVRKNGRPIVPRHARRLSGVRTAESNFSFVRFDDLDATAFSALVIEVGEAFRSLV